MTLFLYSSENNSEPTSYQTSEGLNSDVKKIKGPSENSLAQNETDNLPVHQPLEDRHFENAALKEAHYSIELLPPFTNTNKLEMIKTPTKNFSLDEDESGSCVTSSEDYTFERLVHLSSMIELLKGDKLVTLINIIQSNEPSLRNRDPDDFEFNLVELDPLTTKSLEKYVEECILKMVLKSYVNKNITPPSIKKVTRCQKCKDIVITCNDEDLAPITKTA